MNSYFYDNPTLILFLNEEENFMHGGIAFHGPIINLTDGESYPINNKGIVIKSEYDRVDLKETAMGDKMDYYT